MAALMGPRGTPWRGRIVPLSLTFRKLSRISETDIVPHLPMEEELHSGPTVGDDDLPQGMDVDTSAATSTTTTTATTTTAAMLTTSSTTGESVDAGVVASMVVEAPSNTGQEGEEEGEEGEEEEEEGEEDEGEDDDDDDLEGDDEDSEDGVGLLLPRDKRRRVGGGTLDALLERLHHGTAAPDPAIPPPPPHAAAATAAAPENLTSSVLRTLQHTEDKVVNLLEMAAQTAAELSRVDSSEETRERLRSHIDSFLSTTQEIHQTLREQIKLIPPSLPFEGHSYHAKMDLEISKMQTQIIRNQLSRIRSSLEEHQKPSGDLT